MNKQELIEKYKRLEGVWSAPGAETARQIFLQDLDQLDEPEKVKIPQFTADWIEHFKKTSDWDLFQAMDYLFEHTITCEWIETKDNQELFARAWLDGYEAEKEKRYTVVIKKTKQPLYYNASENKLFFSMAKIASHFTRQQLEKLNFSWVFDCEGIEIEEVED